MIKVNYLKNKKVAVFGLGKAGKATVDALCKSGVLVYAWDDSESGRQAIIDNKYDNLTMIDPAEYNWQEMELLVLSPGIAFTHPKPHNVVNLAKQAQKSIICDIELLYRSCENAKYIGITGTNGKSTTTALTHHILAESGFKTQVGGNLGIPALSLEKLDKNGVYVLEMSSYQLDLIDQTRFDVSVLLNITPDHLERHGGIDGYIKAKCHIYDQQDKNSTAVISVDDDHCRKIYERLKQENKIGRLVPISVNNKVTGGVALIDGVIYNDIDGAGQQIKLGMVDRLRGKHNHQNIIAAFSSCYSIGAKVDDIIKAIFSFAGLPHRMQLAGTIGGVTFINDSKATNADAAANALAAYDNIYWIAGGLSKEGGITTLDKFFPKIKHAFLIGKAQDEFANTLQGKVDFTKCGDLAGAFDAAKDMAVKNSKCSPTVLLSPACASWDQWPNFEVRGEAFCKMVVDLETKLNVTGAFYKSPIQI